MTRPPVSKQPVSKQPGTGGTAPGGTSLADLLDRVVDRGAVVNGDVIIQLAGIDLIRLDLRLLLSGIETRTESARGGRHAGRGAGPGPG